MSSNKRGRPCEVTAKAPTPNGGPWSNQTMKAQFHCWGYRPAKTDKVFNPAFKPKEKPEQLMETVAICELETGYVRLVRPEQVKFLD